jgi:predicted esterase YcpF (UPF0227 family)
MNKILYLHGFNSSPGSHKARVLLEFMRNAGLGDYIDIPEIPPVPAQAIELLQQRAEAIIKDYGLSLAGSSLGGFYATWLAEQYNCPAVLINPAVKPHEILRKYLGENTNYYTAESWVLDEVHINQFHELYIEKISHPHRYLLMLQTGDETLDYREAIEKYAACPSIIEQGGSHEFSGFERHLDKVLEFCNVTQS